MNEIFSGVFREGKALFTVNKVPGAKVYGEKLVGEYREWDPTRSKLGAAMLNGLKTMEIKKGSKILYLGASTGTTPSHLSDIIGNEGIIYALEFAERVFRSLIDLSKKRKNIAPIIADARKTSLYYWIEECDVLYCDIAQPNETEIAIANANEFLKKKGILYIAIKSQSIEVTKAPKIIYQEEKVKLEKAGFTVIELIDLEPYEEKHAMIVARKS